MSQRGPATAPSWVRLRSSPVEARPRRRLLAGIGVALVLGAGAAAAAGAFSGPSPAEIARQQAEARAAAKARAEARLLAKERRIVHRAEALVGVRLPTHPGSPAPAGPAFALASTPRTHHLVVGYVPYWTMAGLAPADLEDVSTVCYYALDVGPSGALVRSGPGWVDFNEPRFSSFVSRAHAAGDRVLLTLSSGDPATIAHLLAHPDAAAARLAGQVLPELSAHGLDGVSVDIEGRSAGERRRFVTFLSAFSARLRRGDPNGEIVLDTYPQSARDKADFLDVKALAPHVDLIFLMGYDMENPRAASAGAPLASPTLGLSDVQSVLDYEKVIPRDKLVLGVPFYGFDFTTKSLRPGARTTTSTPIAVTYAAILQAGRPASWDPASLTPYTTFRHNGKAHQTWYDNPVSIALKTGLAETEGLAGTGVWALGDEGSDARMLQALDGGATPVKAPILGPGRKGAASTSPPPRAGAGT